jgi:hypothetical protein
MRAPAAYSAPGAGNERDSLLCHQLLPGGNSSPPAA